MTDKARQKSLFASIAGWVCLLSGVFLYVTPVFYDWLGFHSGLVAFILVFIGVSLLKFRKDQLNRS